MAEHSAVNRRVAGSSPARGVIFRKGYPSLLRSYRIAKDSFRIIVLYVLYLYSMESKIKRFLLWI